MKKLFPILLVLFVFASAITANAAEPIIETQPTDVTATVGEEVILTCEAVAVENERIAYSWYLSDNTFADGEMLTSPSESGNVYTPDTSTPGIRYYYCMVYATDEDKADMVRSDTVSVSVVGNIKVDFPVITENLEQEYSVMSGAELDISLECEEVQSPIRLEYEWYLKKVGEEEFIKQPQSLSVFTFSSDSAGKYQLMCRVTAIYGTVERSSQSKTATIVVEEHVHEFGEWVLVSSPTCMTEGEEKRNCECGTVETRIVPTLDHDYGEWVVVKEPTVYSYGKETRTCSRCQLSEVREIEPIKYEEPIITHITEETEDEQPTEVTTEANITTNKSTPETEKTEKKQFPFWTVIIIFGIVSTVVGGLLSAWFFLKYKVISERLQKKKKNGSEKK